MGVEGEQQRGMEGIGWARDRRRERQALGLVEGKVDERGGGGVSIYTRCSAWVCGREVTYQPINSKQKGSNHMDTALVRIQYYLWKGWMGGWVFDINQELRAHLLLWPKGRYHQLPHSIYE